MVHVYPDPDELGRVYQADLLINATMPEFAAAAKALLPVDGRAWVEWARAGRQEYLRYIEPTEVPGQLNFGQVLAYLNKHLPAETIVTNGAGNYTAWCHRFYEFSAPGAQVAPISGAMGYGVPAAVAAKLAHPERIVLSIAGDGCFLMNGQELATAMMYHLNIIFIVVNNNMMGTIRMHQERQYPGRVSGTSLVNPDFAAYARAFGAYGEVVERTEDFPAAFERALAVGRPALLELRVDPEALTPNTTLSGTREAALAKKKAGLTQNVL
jgi:acetolactate synthase-1/2/3 large subunit